MAGKAQKAGKSKRPQSEKKKGQRAACRRAAERQHEANAQQQDSRYRHNLRLVKDGELTPWARACAERAYRRLNTCANCRSQFEDGKCAECIRTGRSGISLKAAWEKRNTANQLPAA